ncbi:Nicotinate phosphoribosyltransferase [Lactobacillus helsingborgensis]|uniref:Nicotinate phosphoribosyltransferase n=1 Tax=Lactobacillus helsingborgensis TaxID=1218494 RepID=A0AA47B4Z4_9LACO|nr:MULTISPECIES: nicotinate phosphoribosyltransferase [Lactobacillus]KJY65834.1 Nicotinate phosphoribosyltransferase [Lactobacillus helsingborgensis]MBC6357469.1 nicotinate phosphoribosyltransferase [Lactobacillus helsingborgensis]MBI0111116.1 nicotinate phosphoribosyltransferase [Lactobacillus sp. W8093]MCT6827549.1 nicotinate phosphoribosyltransferase [Lactobacillus helsingborgensis]MCT6846579.1 nicotinate phosphoribosyltransferase [Lactobacillus helsingborgensis]
MFYQELDKDDSLTLHTDLYEINMMYTYFKKGISERNAVFEAYYRQEPFGNGYSVYAGLEHVIMYLKNLKFKESDLKYLKEEVGYDDDFIDYLRHLKMKLTVRSMPEGEIVFANEPLLQVEGPLAQCQLVETAILNIINYQTLLATKAARVKLAVQGDGVMEFGTRRAQETDAALWGTRAAYIGGFDSTSNVRAGKLFGIPISGTHAHSLVEAFGNEYEAFKAYAETHKDCVFLVDTYDTVRSGVPNAIRVADEMGERINFQGVRIDSGDMAYISKQVRRELDNAGYTKAKIYASNDLDETTITSLKMQGAKIDVWGIGTKYITAYDQPALGAVYKLVSIEDDQHRMRDTLKISSNVEKVSTPGKKQVWRISANTEKKNEGDWIARVGVDPRNFDSLYMFHPQYSYINKVVTNYTAEPLLKDIFVDGKLTYQQPKLIDIKKFCAANLDGLWEEYKRSLNPQEYPVDLSQDLYDSKMNIIQDIRNNINKGVGAQ